MRCLIWSVLGVVVLGCQPEVVAVGVGLAPNIVAFGAACAYPDSTAARNCLADFVIEANACSLVAPLRLTMGAQPFEGEWRRCGPSEPEWGEDEAIRYPKDFVLLGIPGAANPVLALSNRDDPGIAWLLALNPIETGENGAMALEVIRRYSGTGGMMEWCILDIDDNRTLGCWEWPSDLETRARALLVSDETFNRGFLLSRGSGGQAATRLVREDGTIHLWRPVAAIGDPNCCPSRGELRAVFHAANRMVTLVSLTRVGPEEE